MVCLTRSTVSFLRPVFSNATSFEPDTDCYGYTAKLRG